MNDTVTFYCPKKYGPTFIAMLWMENICFDLEDSFVDDFACFVIYADSKIELDYILAVINTVKIIVRKDYGMSYNKVFYEAVRIKYKLRIYFTHGPNKGNLRAEEFFTTRQKMDERYAQLYIHGSSTNPTAWEDKNDGTGYQRMMGY